MKINGFESIVKQLIEADTHDEIDRAWLVATFLSLRIAEELGFYDYAFEGLSQSDQTAAFVELCSEPLLQLDTGSKHSRQWKAGYFFNNAILRMVPLAEIRLNMLYEKRMHKKPDNNFWKLAEWYERTYSEKLSYLKKAREHVNAMKHRPHDPEKDNVLKTFDDGLSAFWELISLLRKTVEA